MQDFLLVDKIYENINLQKKWELIKNIRKVITGALEKKRSEKIIGSSLEAHIKVFLSDKIKEKIQGLELDEITITSSFEILAFKDSDSGFQMDDIEGVKVEVEKSNAEKCHRCWKYKKDLNFKDICNRCANVIK